MAAASGTYKIDTVEFQGTGGFTVDEMTDCNYDPGIERTLLGTVRSISKSASFNKRQADMLKFSTHQLKTILSKFPLGWLKLPLSGTAPTYAYSHKRENLGTLVAATSALHKRLKMIYAQVRLGTLNAPLGDLATVDVTVQPVTDGTNPAVVMEKDIVLPTPTPETTVGEGFTLQKFWFNPPVIGSQDTETVELPEVMSVAFDYGFGVETLQAPGRTQDKLCSINQQDPKLTVTVRNLDAAYKILGHEAADYNPPESWQFRESGGVELNLPFGFYLRRKKSGGSEYALDALEHIRVKFPAGCVYWTKHGGSHGEAATIDLTFEPLDNGVDPIMTVVTDVKCDDATALTAFAA